MLSAIVSRSLASPVPAFMDTYGQGSEQWSSEDKLLNGMEKVLTASQLFYQYLQ